MKKSEIIKHIIAVVCADDDDFDYKFDMLCYLFDLYDTESKYERYKEQGNS